MIAIRSIALWALMAFVFVMPWERNVDISWLGGAGTPLGLVAAAAGLVGLIRGGRIRVRKPSLLLVLMMGFVIWSALTTFWSAAPVSTLVRTTTYAQLWIMLWLMWEYVRGEEERHMLLQSYVFGAMIAVTVLIGNLVEGDASRIGTSGLTRYSFAGGNENYLALSLALAIPMAAYLFAAHKRRWLQLVNIGFIPLLLIGIGLTGSRGGAIAGLVGLGPVLMLAWRLDLLQRVLLFVTVTVGGYALVWVLPEATVSRFQSIPISIAEQEFTGREDIWRAGIVWLRENPRATLIGSGSATFRVVVESGLGRAIGGHNAYLNILVENGVIGILLFLTMMAMSLVPNLSAATELRWFAVFLLLGVAIGVFNASWEREKPFWLVLGILCTHRAYIVTRINEPTWEQQGAPEPSHSSVLPKRSGASR